jgi:hypothetical protein
MVALITQKSVIKSSSPERRLIYTRIYLCMFGPQSLPVCWYKTESPSTHCLSRSPILCSNLPLNKYMHHTICHTCAYSVANAWHIVVDFFRFIIMSGFPELWGICIYIVYFHEKFIYWSYQFLLSEGTTFHHICTW